jgi:hypothetical protein
MATATQGTNQELRISPQEAKKQLESGRPVLVLDARTAKVWDKAELKIQGAIRVSPTSFEVDPCWPKDRFTLVY